MIDWFVSPFTGSDALSNIASLATVIAVVIATKKHFADMSRMKKEQHQRETAERKRASENIDRELEDALNALDRNRNKDEALSFETKDGREIFFMNRNLNHDFYDSLIFSGKINFLKPMLQQRIQDF